ncbi:hypothetical protein J5U18_06965 [Sphingobacteriaceae bacterium WQ 2009]|uniref:Uncharacterized protein n=1 Tax=Rhinopithecimicrobium faecis TaxID=2820698 RepID=A0A8T4HA48_9SPHI|nr:hypothetical protein [Sphingobacteriaceae bacterium WQ 2009]
MKNVKGILYVLALFFTIQLGTIETSTAQCAMCSLNAENATKEGNTQGKGLNDGILFLLAIPYLIAGGIGYLWYKNYRTTADTKKTTKLL